GLPNPRLAQTDFPDLAETFPSSSKHPRHHRKSAKVARIFASPPLYQAGQAPVRGSTQSVGRLCPTPRESFGYLRLYTDGSKCNPLSGNPLPTARTVAQSNRNRPEQPAWRDRLHS